MSLSIPRFELLDGLHAGDAEAVATLLQIYAEPLVRFVTHYCKIDKMEAEDIAVEALYRAIERIDTFVPKTENPEQSFRNWLFTIALNLWRSKNRKLQKEIQFGEIDDWRIATKSVERKSPLADALHEALETLPPNHRQVLVLHYSGIELTDIAEMLGVPSNTVRQWKRRGLETLRKNPTLLDAFEAQVQKGRRDE